MFGGLTGVRGGGNQQAEGARMPPLAHRWWNLVVEELPQQRMGKLRPARRIGSKHASAAERLQRPITSFDRKLGHCGRDRWADTGPQNARRLGVAHFLGGNAGKPDAKQGGRRSLGIATCLRQTPTPPHIRGNLFEEEWISGGEPGRAAGRGSRDPGPRSIVQHLGGPGVAEW